MSDILEELIVDEETINKDLLSETLKQFLRIVKQSKHFTFTSNFNSLNPKQKIIVYLLGQKVRKVLGFIEEEKTSPKLMASEIGLSEGTVYPYVKKLENAHLVKNNNGKYDIPNYALESVRNFLKIDTKADKNGN